MESKADETAKCGTKCQCKGHPIEKEPEAKLGPSLTQEDMEAIQNLKELTEQVNTPFIAPEKERYSLSPDCCDRE